MGKAAKALFKQNKVVNMAIDDVFIEFLAIDFIVFLKSHSWIPAFAGMTEVALNAVLQQV